MALRSATRIRAIRANWFAMRIDSQINPSFITFERFARITSNLRFAIFRAPEHDPKKGGFSSRTLRRFARIAWFARICDRFARIGPSKRLTILTVLAILTVLVWRHTTPPLLSILIFICQGTKIACNNCKAPLTHTPQDTKKTKMTWQKSFWARTTGK